MSYLEVEVWTLDHIGNLFYNDGMEPDPLILSVTYCELCNRLAPCFVCGGGDCSLRQTSWDGYYATI